jgi:hypothetical protein
MITFDRNPCEQSEVTCAYAAQALAASEVAAAEAHIASCADCQRELESLRPVVNRFVSWPTDVLRPTTSMQGHKSLPLWVVAESEWRVITFGFVLPKDSYKS